MGATISDDIDANEMLDMVVRSLQAYPSGGGDIRVMTEVDRIVKEAVAKALYHDKYKPRQDEFHFN